MRRSSLLLALLAASGRITLHPNAYPARKVFPATVAADYKQPAVGPVTCTHSRQKSNT
ncbi:hypothetical protein [Streptomyces sp. A1547]|uniref:hypothetical protein n=1 Tax=Streptomyces sp. A1547 TaxID=2563105 RepID=UPI00144A4E18|nr:hypothetical protein [Streptomyces sp. A1547]